MANSLAIDLAKAQKPLLDTIKLEPHFLNFTSSLGLPSSTVHEVFQDSEGYLWFCTAKGVSRFDGQEFLNLGTENGLCSEAVIHAIEDGQKNLWFWTDRNEIFTINLKDLSVSCLEVNDSLTGIIGTSLINRIYTTNDSILIYTNAGKFITLVYDEENRLSRIISVKKFKQNEGEYFFGCHGNGYKHLYFRGGKGGYDENLWNTRSDVIFKYGGTYGHNDFFAVHGFTIMHFDPVNEQPIFEKTMPFNFTGDVYYIDDKIWAGTYNHGLLAFSPDPHLPLVSQLFNGYTITGMLKDQEGGYWVSSLEQGVFYYPNVGIMATQNNYRFPVQLADNNNDIAMIGLNSGECYKFDPENPNILVKTAELPPGTKFYGFEPDSSSTFLIRMGAIDSKTGIVNSRLKNYRSLKNRNGADKVFYIQGTEVYYGDLGESGLMNDSLLDSNWRLGRLNFVQDHNKDSAFLVSQKGLAVFNKKTQQLSYISISGAKGSNIDISSIIPFDGYILAASKKEGLYLIRGGKVVFALNKENGMPTNRCNIIVADTNYNFWIGTDMGVALVQCFQDAIVFKKMLSPATGYSSLIDITSLTGIGKWLLAGNETRLFCLDKKKFYIPANEPGIKLEFASYFDERLYPDENGVFILEPWQRSITFKVSSPTYKNAFHHLYRYNVHELGGVWSSTNKGEVTLTGLAPGNYLVVFEKLNQEGIWQGGNTAFEVLVLPPFYKKTWFLALIASVIIGTVIYIMSMRIRFFKKESALQIGLVKTRNQTLSSQLNPHFLYNVLNTVGGSIVREEKQDAVQTISKFSKLMRMVFDNSQHDLVPLDVELQAVSAYIELEKKRWANSFQFLLATNNISNEELGTYMVPPLLLQPLVENSIWHGISEMESSGVVKLNVKKENGILIISVMDNGKGLKSEKLKGNRKSSIKIIVDRMHLLSEIYGSKVRWRLLSDNSKEWKTIIELRFPLILKENAVKT